MHTNLDIQRPETLEELERYWTETLMPFAASPGMPPDFLRPTTPPAPLLDVELPMSLILSEAAVEAAHFKPSRLLAVVLTACTILLHRLNDAEQVSILTPVTQGGLGEAETNRWLVVKSRVLPEDTITGLLEQVRSNLAAAYAHQQYPFARVLEMLGVSWPANRAPLSDVAVVFDGISRMDVLADVAADLTIVGSMQDKSLALSIRYRPDLFAADTVLGFGQHLLRVLRILLEQPDSRVGELRLLSAENEVEAIERFRLWDRRQLPDLRVEELVFSAAQSNPEQVAFTHGEATLTYSETIARAQTLASILRKEGVLPGDRVAVALDPGLHLPVALLGILVCGAAFVPLDPRHPPSRLQGILKQVKPAAVLAEERLRPTVEGFARMISWEFLTPPDESEAVAKDDLDGNSALAYVIFTSGSTGEPNGVTISHRSLVNYLLWAKDYYLGPDKPTFALYSSIAFDLALTSVFLPLIAGCSTVVFSFDDPIVDMNAIFADLRVGVVKATPSHLKLVRMTDLAGTAVRRVIIGGEAFERDLAESLHKALGPNALIFNEYGPTEATIACTAHQFQQDERRAGTVPIGSPIWNTGIYLLDEERRPVPTSMPGDLWISGVPVATGYLDRLELTCERFVDDPFNHGNRMYATGDRARYDALGHLYYLGRRDHQVKFKGMRIELNEMRVCLNRLPRVRDSVVRIVEDERRNQIMIAYYVARQSIDVSILRTGLLNQLPQEIIPNLFVRMAKLPLTLNGKIDLDRLPSLDEVRKKAPQVFLAPRTATEKAIAAVWSEVLGVSEINVHSNFFELGGHSLLASQVAWKMWERLGTEVPLRLLFDAPTIAEIGAILDERGAPAVPVSDHPGMAASGGTT